MGQFDDSLLYRWFVGLSMGAPRRAAAYRRSSGQSWSQRRSMMTW